MAGHKEHPIIPRIVMQSAIKLGNEAIEDYEREVDFEQGGDGSKKEIFEQESQLGWCNSHQGKIDGGITNQGNSYGIEMIWQRGRHALWGKHFRLLMVRLAWTKIALASILKAG